MPYTPPGLVNPELFTKAERKAANLMLQLQAPSGESTDPTDASSGAVAGGADTPNYGELYDVVGKLYTNHQGGNQHMLKQLGATQR